MEHKGANTRMTGRLLSILYQSSIRSRSPFERVAQTSRFRGQSGWILTTGLGGDHVGQGTLSYYINRPAGTPKQNRQKHNINLDRTQVLGSGSRTWLVVTNKTPYFECFIHPRSLSLRNLVLGYESVGGSFRRVWGRRHQLAVYATQSVG